MDSNSCKDRDLFHQDLHLDELKMEKEKSHRRKAVEEPHPSFNNHQESSLSKKERERIGTRAIRVKNNPIAYKKGRRLGEAAEAGRRSHSKK